MKLDHFPTFQTNTIKQTADTQDRHGRLQGPEHRSEVPGTRTGRAHDQRVEEGRSGAVPDVSHGNQVG